MAENKLINREWVVEGGASEPLNKLKSFGSVEWAEYMDTMSSAGDWTGFFVQKIGSSLYAISFDQTNLWPHTGFQLLTGDVFMSFHGNDVVLTNELINEIKEYYYGNF